MLTMPDNKTMAVWVFAAIVIAVMLALLYNDVPQ
jgi:hypothetical protein